jgi:hypothetical protein
MLLVGALKILPSAIAMLAGGWSPAGLSDEKVVEAAKFAIHSEFPNGEVSSFHIIEAQKQVVAGLKIGIKVALVKRGAEAKCEMREFKVIHKLGGAGMMLLDKVLMTDACPVVGASNAIK